MKAMWKNTFIMFAITLIAGCLLGIVYEVTKEPIEEAKQKAKIAAYQEVFADAVSFEDNKNADLEQVNVEPGFESTLENVQVAYDENKQVLGYVLTITNHKGYGGDIQFTEGITIDGTLNGISILEIKETAGLGMNAESILKPQFIGKNVEKFEYTKTASTNDAQIDAISGATITTSAVVNGVNAGLYYFQNYLNEGGDVNE